MSDIIKDTEQYSVADLLDEVERRKEILEVAEANKLPEVYYPYQEMKGMPCDDGKYNYYHVHINDGSEGFDYLVALKRNESDDHWEDEDVQEDNIRAAIKHHFINFSHSLNCGVQSSKLPDITEIGRYSLRFILAEETLLSDEEEET